MEEIHRNHNIELDNLTQTQDDDTMTQGSIMSRSTIFTSATSNTNAITQEDMEAFQRAVDAKSSELTSEYNALKQKHRSEEDETQKQILNLQAEKTALESGEFHLVYQYSCLYYLGPHLLLWYYCSTPLNKF